MLDLIKVRTPVQATLIGGGIQENKGNGRSTAICSGMRLSGIFDVLAKYCFVCTLVLCLTGIGITKIIR